MNRIDWVVVRRLLGSIGLTLTIMYALVLLVESLSTSRFAALSRLGGIGLAILASIANSKTSDFLGGIVGKPSVLEQQEALVSGFQTAFIVAAALVAAGTILAALLLRRRDVARIEAGDAVAVPVA